MYQPAGQLCNTLAREFPGMRGTHSTFEIDASLRRIALDQLGWSRSRKRRKRALTRLRWLGVGRWVLWCP